MKCGVSPLDPSRQSIKFNQILSDPLVITHMEILKLRFSFSFWIKRAEVATEFGDEFRVVGQPGDVNSKVKDGSNQSNAVPLR